jgi:hypothetical protein
VKGPGGIELERVLATILLGLAVLHGISFARAMVPSSLLHDELLSVTKYQARGLRYTLTTYEEPNNHILFNALSSLLPEPGSAAPLRARAISIVAVGTLLGLLGVWAWRRLGPLEAALLIALFAGNPILLGLWLGARGYGLMALFAGLAAITFLEWERTRRPAALALLAGAAVLGSWTVPTFLLFAAPLLALTFFLRPGLATLGAGLASAGLLVLVQAPVLGAMRRSLGSYSVDWGGDFASPAAALRVLRLSLLPRIGADIGDGLGGLLAFALALLVLLAWRRHREAGRAPLFLAVAGATCLALCLFLKSPVLRSTAFVVVPIAVAGATAGSLLLRSLPAMRPPAAAFIAAAVAAISLPELLSSQYEPAEHWKEVAEIIESTFPRGTRIYSSSGPLTAGEPRWGDFLHAFMRHPADFPAEKAFDELSFREARSIVHERPYREHIDPHSLPPGALRIPFPQQHLGYQALWVTRPAEAHIAAVTDAAGERLKAIPRDGLTLNAGQVVVLSLESGWRYRSVLLLFDHPPDAFSMSLTAEGNGPPFPRSVSAAPRGDILLVPLGDETATGLRLQTASNGQAFRLRDGWAYPSTGDR